MLKKIILTAALSIILLSSFAQQSGEAIIRKMYSTYAPHWRAALLFGQTTERYRNDSLIKTEQWHEEIFYPNKLRIDILPLSDHNSYIIRNDSTYIIRGGKVTKAVARGNDLMFLLGGLYAVAIDTALHTLRSQGYDLSKSYEDTWHGKPVLVIGASAANQQVNQLWVDKANFYLVRQLKYTDGDKEELIFGNHIKIGNGWTETTTRYYNNDKLIQSETYHNCTIPSTADAQLFDPVNYKSPE